MSVKFQFVFLALHVIIPRISDTAACLTAIPAEPHRLSAVRGSGIVAVDSRHALKRLALLRSALHGCPGIAPLQVRYPMACGYHLAL
jgi:hypothetical protein